MSLDVNTLEFGISIIRAQYALERLSGFERRPIEQEAAMPLKRERFAEFYTELDAREPIAAVTVSGQVKLQREIARRRGHETSRGFLPVAAPATEIPDPGTSSIKAMRSCRW